MSLIVLILYVLIVFKSALASHLIIDSKNANVMRKLLCTDNIETV